MKTTLWLWLAIAATAGAGAATAPARGAAVASPEGHWQGVLKAGGAELTLVLNVVADGGTLKATLDSPDQGSTGIPVDEIKVDKGELTFRIKAIQGAFRGKLDAKGAEAVGTWTQLGKSNPITLKKVDRPPLVIPPALVGTWEGKLKAGAGIEIRLVLKVEKRKDGAMLASFASPDQGAPFLPINTIALDGTEVSIESKLIGGKFAGTLDGAKAEIAGKFSQGGATIPLTLKKTDKVSEPRRTQVPKAPFPYKSEDVAYPNKAAGISMAGTLTIPAGKGPFPVGLMITGSGPQDRDEALLGHKPFLVIADALARRGVAVLRVDDRGVGKSTGSQSEATSADFATDVEAGIAYLKTRKEFDPRAIGLIGHSEGGLIAPMVAAKSGDVGFIVLLAGTGTDGATIMKAQTRLLLKAAGAPDATIQAQGRMLSELLAVILAQKETKADEARLAALLKASIAQLPEADRKALDLAEGPSIEALVGRFKSPWFRFFLAYDPRPALAKVRCPVLAINGANDLQVPPKENLAAIEAALKSGGNAKVTIRELPGLNHLFQKSKTGSPAEYASIEETVDPAVLTLLADWILETTRRK